MGKRATFNHCQSVLKELREAEHDPWADSSVYYYIGIAIELAETLAATTGYATPTSTDGTSKS
jgi:hypothetical protein